MRVHSNATTRPMISQVMKPCATPTPRLVAMPANGISAIDQAAQLLLGTLVRGIQAALSLGWDTFATGS